LPRGISPSLHTTEPGQKVGSSGGIGATSASVTGLATRLRASGYLAVIRTGRSNERAAPPALLKEGRRTSDEVVEGAALY